MEQVVEQVLATVRQRLGAQYTLDDLARIAKFSKFHFARAFRRVTGVSPRRFLYAMRMDAAKHLLLTTGLTVAAVAHEVGYDSVGTFTSRFTASVGVPPAAYRRLRGDLLSAIHQGSNVVDGPGVISGLIENLECCAAGAPTMVGLFRQQPPEGLPAMYGVVRSPGRAWSFQNVPVGRWYVLAVSSAPRSVTLPLAVPRWTLTSLAGPVTVCPDNTNVEVTVRLRPMRSVDPPILVPLPAPDPTTVD